MSTSNGQPETNEDTLRKLEQSSKETKTIGLKDRAALTKALTDPETIDRMQKQGRYLVAS